MPRLVNAFAQVQGDETKMEAKLDFYEKRLQEFIEAAKTPKELYERFLMVTRGAKFNHEFESPWFYQDESLVWHILCPHLQRKGESMVMEKNLALRLTSEQIEVWSRTVEFDCRLKRNPARLGWNVEGLVIGVLKYMRSIFEERFEICIEYSRGQEASALSSQSIRSLKDGILMVPKSFNEEALDVFYIMLADGRFKLIAVQISVAKWKTKLAKGSHQIWKDEILKRMEPVLGIGNYSQQFIYLMPTAAGEQGDTSEPDFKREPFGSIRDSLKWIDKALSWN